MDNLPAVISAICGVISLALVSALIFSRPFRRDVLGGKGEATVLGVLTAKGAVIIVLCSLFLAGMLYPIVSSNAQCHGALHGLRMGLGDKARHNAKSVDVQELQETINKLFDELDSADKSCR